MKNILAVIFAILIIMKAVNMYVKSGKWDCSSRQTIESIENRNNRRAENLGMENVYTKLTNIRTISSNESSCLCEATRETGMEAARGVFIQQVIQYQINDRASQNPEIVINSTKEIGK